MSFSQLCHSTTVALSKLCPDTHNTNAAGATLFRIAKQFLAHSVPGKFPFKDELAIMEQTIDTFFLHDNESLAAWAVIVPIVTTHIVSQVLVRQWRHAIAQLMTPKQLTDCDHDPFADTKNLTSMIDGWSSNAVHFPPEKRSAAEFLAKHKGMMLTPIGIRDDVSLTVHEIALIFTFEAHGQIMEGATMAFPISIGLFHRYIHTKAPEECLDKKLEVYSLTNIVGEVMHMLERMAELNAKFFSVSVSAH